MAVQFRKCLVSTTIHPPSFVLSLGLTRQSQGRMPVLAEARPEPSRAQLHSTNGSCVGEWICATFGEEPYPGRLHSSPHLPLHGSPKAIDGTTCGMRNTLTQLHQHSTNTISYHHLLSNLAPTVSNGEPRDFDKGLGGSKLLRSRLLFTHQPVPSEGLSSHCAKSHPAPAKASTAMNDQSSIFTEMVPPPDVA